ncbi:hypothetical protein GUITHDRAFT_149464 [Guillardia theta CCMP2712]|uniref:Uncharacterized protein n=1 Tax=Guillardia theta (strain CCMP2712) TaxID=905079 RepID=L1I5N5_GUITC|nr:hypothetical protein GUITHDRAFT_149464 [Guillardia theta CCMP2712]EKX31170.1 hypothetical protein GUITHDRAFT_149464 [Guillardia theta CCMP2712]|eukprot:XP_005818150.1 hypothetical protein GUITHDRAFT_149464 [Guillardia theta CCMP2712]
MADEERSQSPPQVYVCKNGIIQSDMSMGMPSVILAENKANGIYIDELDGKWDKFPPATYVIDRPKNEAGATEGNDMERADHQSSEKEADMDVLHNEASPEAADRPDRCRDERADAKEEGNEGESSQSKGSPADQQSAENGSTPPADSHAASSKRPAPDYASPAGEEKDVEGAEEREGKRAKNQEILSDGKSAQNSDNESTKSNNDNNDNDDDSNKDSNNSNTKKSGSSSNNKSGVSLRPRRSVQKSITYIAHGPRAGMVKEGNRKREPDKTREEANKIAEDLLELSDRIPYSAVWQREQSVWRKFKKACRSATGGNDLAQLLAWLSLQSCESLDTVRDLMSTYEEKALNWKYLADLFSMERGEISTWKSDKEEEEAGLSGTRWVSQQRIWSILLSQEVRLKLQELRQQLCVPSGETHDDEVSWISVSILRHQAACLAQIPQGESYSTMLSNTLQSAKESVYLLEGGGEKNEEGRKG